MNNYDYTYQDTWITRDTKLKKLNLTYDEYLNSDYWKQTLKKANSRSIYNKCEYCSNKRDDLHHSSYKWLGEKNELMLVYPACHEHHNFIHQLAKESNLSIRLVTNFLRNPINPICNKNIKKYSVDFYEKLSTLRKFYPDVEQLINHKI